MTGQTWLGLDSHCQVAVIMIHTNKTFAMHSFHNCLSLCLSCRIFWLTNSSAFGGNNYKVFNLWKSNKWMRWWKLKRVEFLGGLGKLALLCWDRWVGLDPLWERIPLVSGGGGSTYIISLIIDEGKFFITACDSNSAFPIFM
jgi:hypothetical protein